MPVTLFPVKRIDTLMKIAKESASQNGGKVKAKVAGVFNLRRENGLAVGPQYQLPDGVTSVSLDFGTSTTRDGEVEWSIEAEF